MYKTRNTGTWNGMRRTWGMGGILYFGECSETFREKSSKNPEECPQTFREMSPNILGNIVKHSRECPQTFQGMSPNILGNAAEHSGECY